MQHQFAVLYMHVLWQPFILRQVKQTWNRSLTRCECVCVIQVEYHREYAATRGQVTATEGTYLGNYQYDQCRFDFTFKLDVSI